METSFHINFYCKLVVAEPGSLLLVLWGKEWLYMAQKKIIAFINAENEVPSNVECLAERYSCEGADGLFFSSVPCSFAIPFPTSP